MSLNLSLNLRNQKQTQPHCGLKTVAKPPLIAKCSAQSLLELPTVGAACARFLPSTAEGAAVTPPGHEGAVGKQWARVSSLERRGCCPHPRGPRMKGLLLPGLLGLLPSSQQVCPDFQGEQAARVRTCPVKTCSEPVESLAVLLSLSSVSCLPTPTSPYLSLLLLLSLLC